MELQLEAENDCPNQGSQGDPHLHQSIVDSKTGQLHHICYDVVGKSDQSIFILYDPILKVKVKGILKDDYYIHEIRITVDNQVIKIKTVKTAAKNYGGIIGDIAKKSFKVFPSAQSDTRVVFQIIDEYVQAIKKTRYEKNCWFILLRHLISKDELSKYIY
ncbi:DgyrCDS14753 [Dimorphilus gyrociliatus]|uniref:DgyrCDS14753 n=1 Tax=Dimorphilus gyrociliatus TaxID=2664684 RepID=A0A7I8WF43_9ANNE|nr:DgyrCDS14753 [Dimorphilus gyrociliatus]